MKNLFLLCVVVVLLMPSIVYSATTWYMPEGCTNGFDLWVLVTNPNSSTANITYTFYTGSHGTYTYTDTVSGNSRHTIHVNSKLNQVAGSTINDDVSVKVECTNGLNIYAERAMYWPNDGTQWIGGHSSRAISGLEGCYTEISDPGATGTWPITISTSGSYKLIGNITNCPIDTTAIEITASDVTLDLNGFSIIGPGNDQGSSGTGIYVSSSNTYNVDISNGVIRGFRMYGINAASTGVGHMQINNVKFISNGGLGLYLSGTCSVVEKCYFRSNGDAETVSPGGGVYVNHTAFLKNNTFMWNKGYGIYVGGLWNFVKENIVMGTTTGVGIYVARAWSSNRIEGNHLGNTLGIGDIEIVANASSLCIRNTYCNGRTIGANNFTQPDTINEDIDI